MKKLKKPKWEYQGKTVKTYEGAMKILLIAYVILLLIGSFLIYDSHL